MSRKIVILAGSARPGAASVAAAKKVAAHLEAKGAAVDLVEPAALRLGVPGVAVEGDDAAALRDRVAAADAAVFVTPEYHGSYSSTMKVLIDNLGFPSVLKGKPAVLVGVAAGRIGAIKALEHLRSVLSHVGMHVAPQVSSTAGVGGEIAEDGAFKDGPAAEFMLATAEQALG